MTNVIIRRYNLIVTGNAILTPPQPRTTASSSLHLNVCMSGSAVNLVTMKMTKMIAVVQAPSSFAAARRSAYSRRPKLPRSEQISPRLFLRADRKS